MKKFPFSPRILAKAGLACLLLMLLGSSGLMAEAVEGPYAETDKVVLLDDSVMLQFRIFVGAIGFILLFAIFILFGALSKHPEKLSLKAMLQSITAKNASDPEMHHEYDGIRELDNPIPGYLQMIMYGSILFGIVYLLHFHVLNTGALSDEEYQIEMAEAELKYRNVELPDAAIVQITDGRRLEKAGVLFAENCATCHGGALEGDSGPNLTDPYWLHGGKVKDIYATISEGVPGKTMIGWKKKLSSTQRLELASFILSLQGSKPANPKDPEGTRMGEEGQDAARTKADSTQTSLQEEEPNQEEEEQH